MDMDTRHVATRQQSDKDANRQDFPELIPFVDALNAAMMAHGTPPAKVTYLERPGKTLGKPMDKSKFVPVTFLDGKVADGSEMRRTKNKTERRHKDHLIR